MKKFPLSVSPYNSRNSQFLEQRITGNVDYKNYVYTAFVPGYPLQAQELNEIQERWQQQMEITQSFLTDYITKTDSSETISFLSSTGALVVGVEPFDVNISGLSVTLTLNSAEENYVSVYDNGMRYWIKIPQISLIVSMQNSNQKLIKLNTRVTYVPCSSTEDAEGFYFNDNSSGSYVSGTCGAGRIKVEVLSMSESSSSSINENNLIFRIQKDSDGQISVVNAGTGFIVPQGRS
jgi:hypothetical protein